MKARNLRIASQILALGLSISASQTLKAQSVVNDLDRDGIPNISDTDIDNDGIPNGIDTNIDGGTARSGPLKGQYIGDRILNDDAAELDMDSDGLLDNAANEMDIDADGLADNSPSELDIDGDGRVDTAVLETDIDGDGLADNALAETDIDGDGLADDAMTETDIDGDSALDNAANEQDIDGDGLANNNPNTESDMDGDGINNATDPDKNGDGVLDDSISITGFFHVLYSSSLQSIPFMASGSSAIANTNQFLGSRSVVVEGPSGRTIYSIETNGAPGLLISNRPDAPSGRFMSAGRLVTLPGNFPELSWAMGITYDSKRNLIVVSSLGGEGYIYRYDIAQDKWIDFTSLQGVDLTSLTYNAVTDSLAGWQIPYGSLCTLSADGQVQNSIPLNERLPEFGYSRTDYGFNQSIRVIANGDNFYLASHADSSPFTPNREGVITKIWSYNTQQDKVTLTYSRR